MLTQKCDNFRWCSRNGETNPDRVEMLPTDSIISHRNAILYSDVAQTEGSNEDDNFLSKKEFYYTTNAQ